MAASDYDDAEIRRLLALAEKRAHAVGKGWITPEDAEEIASDVVAKLVRQAPAPDNPDAWITVVAKNQVLDLARANGRRPQAEDDDVPKGDRPDPSLRTWAQGLGSVSAAGMRGQAMLFLLAKMGEVFSEREIEILMLIAEGLSYEEIAAELGYWNAGSVKSTVRKIRLKAEGLDRGALEALKDHPHNYPDREPPRRAAGPPAAV